MHCSASRDLTTYWCGVVFEFANIVLRVSIAESTASDATYLNEWMLTGTARSCIFAVVLIDSMRKCIPVSIIEDYFGLVTLFLRLVFEFDVDFTPTYTKHTVHDSRR